MDDLYFEKELRNRVKRRLLNNRIHIVEDIERETDFFFNDQINCGGYALKIDYCYWPTYQENFASSVSSLLDKFKFVRLLGDTHLLDDEYMVIYRAPKGENRGHHFIRVDSDGTVREKDGAEKPKIFENWGVLNGPDIQEAIFAVKKEHKMFGYTNNDINHNNYGLDFENTAHKAYSNRKNSFDYHNHSFHLKKDTKNDIIVITNDRNEIVSNVIADDEYFLLEVLEGQQQYIENYSGKIKPRIVNGKLENLREFKERQKPLKEYSKEL